MVASSTDVSFVYSGGLNNSDPSASLGGDASIHHITTNLNNLFDDVDSTESEIGDVEYRAFYIFNDNDTYSLRNTKIWIHSQVEAGADVELGVNLVDEIQKLTITPQADITSGDFKIEISYYVGPTLTVETTDTIIWSSNFSTLAQNIETALNDLDKFSEIEVSSLGDAIFDIFFQGLDGNKKQPTLTIVDNNLLSSGDPADILVELVLQGSPINTVAADIGTESIAPSGILFSAPSSEENSLEIGLVAPLEGFPVWIKRTVGAQTEGLELDGFSFKIKTVSP